MSPDEPNARKELDLVLAAAEGAGGDAGRTVRRYPLRTDLYAREDDLEEKTLGYLDRFFAGLPAAGGDHDVATKGRWYLLMGVDLAEYRNHMRRRSAKWETVALPADDFRSLARPIESWL